MSHPASRKDMILKHSLRALLRRQPVAFAMLGMSGFAIAGPTGEDVVGGDADIIRPDAVRTVINQLTDRAAINWQTFNIDADEYVIFNQPGASSIVLNRVLGGDASYILGHLQANGQVFLLNPHGVFFTHGAALDVQGFLGSTLDMSPAGFMNGDYTLTRSAQSPANTQVINDGSITAGPGGYVVLAGDYTENTGIIAANAGTVALVSGNALTLDIEGDGLVNFAIDEATLSEAAGVRNAGSLIADGGRVIMTAKVANDLVATAVNNEGLVRARSIEERNGEIFLVGHGGDVVNNGVLDADGENADGGFIAIYGDRDVALADGAIQTAAGDANHEGGVIRAIAEEHLDFRNGNVIRVSGGPGLGGFVEVSGHGSIALRGITDLGSGGTLLIDPSVITIQTGTISGSVGTLGTGNIATVLNGGNNLVIAASSSIGAATDVTSITATGTGNLTIGIGVAASSGTLGTQCFYDAACYGTNPVFTPSGNGTVNLGGVDIDINGNLTIQAGISDGSLTVGNITAGGNVLLDAGSNSTGSGGDLTVGQINTPGNITLISESFTVAGIGQTTAGSNLLIQGEGNSADVNITGGIHMGGSITITTRAHSDGGANITVGGDILTFGDITLSADAASVSNGAVINVQGLSGNNINIDAIGASAGMGGSFMANGNVVATSNIDIQVTGGLTGGGNIDVVGGNVQAAGVVNLSATGGTSAADGGNIDIDGTVSGAMITLDAQAGSNGSGTGISIGGASGAGNFIATAAGGFVGGDINIFGAVNMGGAVTLTADAGSSSGGHINASGNITGASISLTANGGSLSGGGINVGNVTATSGAVMINATGSSGAVNVAAGAVSGAEVTIHASNTGSNSATILTGDITATAANIDLLACGGDASGGACGGGGGGSGDGVVDVGALTAAAGNINAFAYGGGAGGHAFVITETVDAAGQVNLYAGAPTGDDITVNGDITAGGNIWVWNIANGNVEINGNINGSANVTLEAVGVNSQQGQVEVTGSISGANIVINADGASIDGGEIQTGAITATGFVNLDASAASDGANITVGGIDAGGSVHIVTNADNIGGTVTINGNLEGGTLFASVTGGLGGANFDVNSGNVTTTTGGVSISAFGGGSMASGGNITLDGDVVSATSILLTANGSAATSGGDLIVNGAMTASAGSTITLSAIGGTSFGGDIILGNVSGGEFGATATGNGSSDGNITVGNMNMAGDVMLDANGGFASGGNITTGNIQADGRVEVMADGGDSHNFGDITARHISAEFWQRPSGSLNVAMGDLHVNGNTQGLQDVVVQLHEFSSNLNATLQIGSVTAENGGIFLDARGFASNGTANILVGDMQAAMHVDVQAINSVSAHDITVANPNGMGRVSITAGQYGTLAPATGNILVDGNVSVSGRATSNNPFGAEIMFDAGQGNNNITVTGTTTLNAQAAAFSVPPMSLPPGPDAGTQSSSGSMGVARMSVRTSDGDVTLGNIAFTAVGEAALDVQAGNIDIGDIAMNVADGSFTRVSDLTMCDGMTCAIDRTETMHDGGRAEVRLEHGGGTGSSAAFGNINLTAGNAHVDVRGFVDVTGGGIAINATGNDFEIASTGTFDTQAIDYAETDLGGGATVNIESAASGGAVILNGAVDLAARGNAELHVLADTIKLRGVDVTATAGTFTRSGTPAGEEHDGPFSRDGGGGPGIDEGTMTGGGAEVQLAGYNPDPNFEPPGADTVIIDGAVTIAAPGRAQLQIYGDAVTVTGNINVAATAMQQDGTFADAYIDSSGASVESSGTVVSNWGSADVDVSGSGNIALANVTISGPTAAGRVEGVNVRAGSVSVTASGGELDYTETLTVDGVTELLEINGPNTITGLALRADNLLELTGNLDMNAAGVGGVLLVGDVIKTRDISVTVTDGNYTVLSDAFGATATDFTVGNAILGIIDGTAQVNGSVTVNASRDVHFGGAAVVSGDFAVNAGAALTPTIPARVQFLNALDSEDDDASIVLPATFNVQAANIGLAATAGNLDVRNAVLNAGNAITLSAGNHMLVSNISMDAQTVQMTAGGDITNSLPAGTITAGALAISAGGNVSLADTVLIVGSGAIATVPGDSHFLDLLVTEDIAIPADGPSLSVSGHNVALGDVSVAGDYIFLRANQLTLNGTVTTSNPDLLLQVAPLGLGATFGLEQSAPGGGDAAYVYNGLLDRFNAATLALGTTNHTGAAGIGANGTVNIGDTNLFVLTAGEIRGLENVLSTGVVKDLSTLISGVFEVPQTDEIDTRQDVVTSLRDEFALEDRSGIGEDDEEEGDEEGEDTDTDTDVEGDEESLISRDTADEELLCR